MHRSSRTDFEDPFLAHNDDTLIGHVQGVKSECKLDSSLFLNPPLLDASYKPKYIWQDVQIQSSSVHSTLSENFSNQIRCSF